MVHANQLNFNSFLIISVNRGGSSGTISKNIPMNGLMTVYWLQQTFNSLHFDSLSATSTV